MSGKQCTNRQALSNIHTRSGSPQKRRKKKTSGQPGSLFPEAGIPVDNFLYFSENLYPLIIGKYVILHTLCNIIR